MKNIVLISHGKMADGVKSSLEMIIGKQEHVYAVSLKEDGDNIQFENDLVETMKALKGRTLIISDLLGGTPCNVAVKNYLENEEIDIMAGMSLPLVIESALNSNATTNELLKLTSAGIVDVKKAMNQAEEIVKEDQSSESLNQYQEFAGQANIVNVRIDERLIHGQVAGIWSTSLDTQRIIVINDEAANDPLQKSSLRMAAPASMRLSVLPVEKAAENINAGKYGNQRIFLLFKNPKDVLRFLEAGGVLPNLNVGNMSYKEGAREVTKSIQVLPEEEQIFEAIADKGITITAQLVPNDPVVDFLSKLRN
ncbi:PTS mannose/fructose/sorbose transporter subunit IIAB [Enterococcus sp. LJL99]